MQTFNSLFDHSKSEMSRQKFDISLFLFFFSPFFGRLIIVYPFWNIQLFIFQKKKKKSNKRRRVRCQTSVSIKMQVRVKRTSIYLPIMCSLFYYSNFLLFLLKIANYHPFDEDLDYPAKLERSAEGLSVTVSDYCYFLFELIFFFWYKRLYCFHVLCGIHTRCSPKTYFVHSMSLYRIKHLLPILLGAQLVNLTWL